MEEIVHMSKGELERLLSHAIDEFGGMGDFLPMFDDREVEEWLDAQLKLIKGE